VIPARSYLYNQLPGFVWTPARTRWNCPGVGELYERALRIMARTNLPAIASGEGGLSHYLNEIRKFPMLEPKRGVHARQGLQGA